LVNWRNNVGASNVSSSHVHNLVYPVIGNGKTIYSIKEDISGNIYLGTSDGFLIIPSDPAYEFIINDVPLYFYGSDLWTLFNQAKAQYEAETGDPFVVTQDLYGQQISDAVSQLVNDGDSVFFSGVGGLGLHTDYIMIKRVTSFKMPEFRCIKTVPEGYQSSNEMVIGTATINNVASFVVERDFNDTPIWSIEINTNVIPGQNYIPTSVFTDVIVNGSNLIAKSTGLNKSPYQEWISIEPPFFVNIMRKLIKDTSGSYWICTDMGIMVSRSYSFGNSFSLASVPASNPNIQDILEGETGVIYCASASGIYKTTDGGKTWLELLTSVNGFKQIVKDKSLDKTNTLDGHYHYFEVDSDGNGFLGTSIGTGTQHVHIVTSWVVVETLGHTHSMVATMYALDTNKTIWKSIDNGTTWVLTGSLPSGDCGDIFSAFGYLFVSQNDGLYRSQNTNTWTKILNDKIYSFAWSYDMVELLLGAYNVLYGTRDGSTFTSIYSFVAGPHVTLVENNDKKYFGYAYSNQNETFNFKNLSLGGSEVSALVDFGKWYPQNGSWKNTDKYDVYVNYKRVLSTKFNEDKRDIFGYNFTVYPTDGLLDFGATTELTRSANVYSSAIVVANSSGFAVGDLINIMSNTTYYATIVDISGDNFTLDSRLSEHIGLPATVNKISNLDSNTDVMVNIYNSLLSNIGVLTHEQIEDGLSNYSDGRPYKLNDTYLSNLLQLTQAVRYVYSDINSEFLNSLFYDFRYSFDPLDPFYINKYIDVSTSDIYNQKIYESVFVTEGAKNINRILVGYGAFAGNILVATDVGVFIAQYTENLEANWFYVTQLPYIAYDLMVFGNQLMVATSNGIYYSGDLKTWTLTDSPVAKFPTYCFGLRWIANNSNVVIVPSHTAQFQKDPSTGLGLITATSGLPYKDLFAYRGIYITNAGDKNGNYVIKSILDDGSGYGSRILLTSAFDTPDEIISGVQIEMATWWEQWTGDINDSNPNLTNTILAGQQDKIIINDGGNVSSWVESTVDIVNFIPKQFLPLVNGSLLFIGNSSKETGQVNCLCKSDDLGSNWTTMKTLNEVWGTISSVSISDFNNSVLNVSFTQPQKYVYTNGVLDQHNISIFNNSSSALYSGKIVWNQNLNGQDTITVYGNELYNFGNVLTNCVFIIQPTKINGVVETSHKTLIFATDQGLFDDDTLAIHNYTISSTVVGVGINGTAKAIDISGAIVYITKDTATGYSLLSVTVDANVRATDVVGKSFYITDAFPVEKYEIVANESISVGDYLTIEIKTETLLSSDYIGRRFRIVGSTSRVYTNFDKPVLPNQLNGGNIIISSEDKNGNFGQNYAISSNGLDYIDLKEALVPSTTLVNPPISAEANTSSTSVVASLNVGQNFRVFDSNDKLILWVTLDRNVKENSLVGFKLKMMDSDGNLFYKLSDGEFEPIYTTIISNLNNSITLDTNGYYTEGGQVALAFGVGSKPELEGFMFEQMGGFSHLLTSTNEDHYHQVEMVNAVVSGSILSFSNNNASYVDINVTDTQNFNTSLVQYRGDLFQDAQIIFTLPQSVNLRYISQVISHNATSIRVRIKSASYWNFSAFDLLKVSEGWTWQIDGTNYGYAQDTDMIYNDFEVLTIGITETAKKGDDLLILTNTSGIIVGDKIKIQDDTLSYNIKYVEQVVDTVTLKLTTTLSRTYFKTRNPQIKVLRNIFANTHIHQVRNNEVENITVSDYLDVGYPAQHSHTVLPLIANVTTLLNQGSTIYAIGSSSKLYNSNDNGLTWQKNVDLNDFLEGSLDVMGATTAILNNSKLIVGASDGSLFAQTSVDNVIISNVDPVG
jgi:photosystem II stability/assembly factor-like uncharacterized protein